MSRLSDGVLKVDFSGRRGYASRTALSAAHRLFHRAKRGIRVGTMKFFERRADGSNRRLIRGDRHTVSPGSSAAATTALLVLEAGGNSVDTGRAAGLSASFPSSFGSHEMLPDHVMLEGRFPVAMFDALRGLGHDARGWQDFTFRCGAVRAVLHDGASGVKIAAADPRRNTGVAGW